MIKDHILPLEQIEILISATEKTGPTDKYD